MKPKHHAVILCAAWLLAATQAARPAKADQTIARLYLFIHPMPSRPSVLAEYVPKWNDLVTKEGPKEENAICIIPFGPRKQMGELENLARRHFGRRCFIKPYDNSPATKVIIADDLYRTLSHRGSLDEWVPMEIADSNHARRWTEGLKKGFREQGLTYDPQTLEVVACGQQWTGCLTKFALFMTRYLDASRPPIVRADLSPYAGFPFKATFRECVPLDRHVQLYLIETADGYPMAQYLDGLRAVWEPPHIASVPISPSKVELFSNTPNRYQRMRRTEAVCDEGIVVDVGDGTRPIITTIIGRGIGYKDFRAALAKAIIKPLPRDNLPVASNLPLECSELLWPRNCRLHETAATLPGP